MLGEISTQRRRDKETEDGILRKECMKSFSEYLFRLAPANFRSKLGLSLSVVEERNSAWYRNTVLETQLVRKACGEDYVNGNSLAWMRRRVSFSDKYTYVFRRALVSLERGRVSANGKWIVESFGNPVNAPCEVIFLRLFAWLFRLLGKCKKLPDNENRWYVYCRYDGYFHFVAESLVTLLYSLKVLPKATVVVSKEQYATTPYFRQYLELMRTNGLIHDIVEVGATFIDASNFVMTAFEADAGSICKQSVELLREALLPKDSNHGARRIFLTRKGRRCFDNQAVLENIAMDFGFEVVDSDGMSVEDQIRLFSEVDILIANHGAGLTNMIYMKPGGRVLELFSDRWKNDCYFRLSSIMQHRYDSIVADAIGFDGWGKIHEEIFVKSIKNVLQG